MLSKSHLIPITRTISLERVPSCAFCCWSQLGQGKYLDNINSCGESKTPACFSSLLVIILLITQHVLKTQPSAVGQRQSFCCWLWPGTAQLWCSAKPPQAEPPQAEPPQAWLRLGADSARGGWQGLQKEADPSQRASRCSRAEGSRGG